MAKINEIDITSLTFQEGAAPATPAATKWKAYFKTDGIYIIDDAGTETGPLVAASGTAAGEEFDYVQNTSTVTLTGTTEGTANTCITGTSQAYEAVPTLIEVFTPRIDTVAGSAAAVFVLLFDSGTVIGRLGVVNSPTTATTIHSFYGAYRLTPTAATHQYIVKAYSSVANSVFGGGAGGTGTSLPSFLRITRV